MENMPTCHKGGQPAQVQVQLQAPERSQSQCSQLHDGTPSPNDGADAERQQKTAPSCSAPIRNSPAPANSGWYQIHFGSDSRRRSSDVWSMRRQRRQLCSDLRRRPQPGLESHWKSSRVSRSAVRRRKDPHEKAATAARNEPQTRLRRRQHGCGRHGVDSAPPLTMHREEAGPRRKRVMPKAVSRRISGMRVL